MFAPFAYDDPLGHRPRIGRDISGTAVRFWRAPDDEPPLVQGLTKDTGLPRPGELVVTRAGLGPLPRGSGEDERDMRACGVHACGALGVPVTDRMVMPPPLSHPERLREAPRRAPAPVVSAALTAPRGDMRRRLVALLQEPPDGRSPVQTRQRLGVNTDRGHTRKAMARDGLLRWGGPGTSVLAAGGGAAMRKHDATLGATPAPSGPPSATRPRPRWPPSLGTLILAVMLALLGCSGGRESDLTGTWTGTLQDSRAGRGMLLLHLSHVTTQLTGTWQQTFPDPRNNTGGTLSGTASRRLAGNPSDVLITMIWSPAQAEACTFTVEAMLDNNDLNHFTGTYAPGDCPQPVSGSLDVTRH